jgi:hypothetical protein
MSTSCVKRASKARSQMINDDSKLGIPSSALWLETTESGQDKVLGKRDEAEEARGNKQSNACCELLR